MNDAKKWYIWRDEEDGQIKRIGGPFDLDEAKRQLKDVNEPGRAPDCFIGDENGKPLDE